MKKYVMKSVFLLLLLAAAGTSEAQLAKGNLLLEGSFGNIDLGVYDYNTQTGSTTTKSDAQSVAASFYPRVGFVLSEQFVVGTQVSISFYNSSGNYFTAAGVKTSDYKSGNMSIGIQPFVRYYFGGSKNGKSLFYGQASAGISVDLSSSYESKAYNAAGVVTTTYKYNYPKKYNRLLADIMAGWNRFFTETVALNLALGYRYTRSKQAQTFTTIPAVGPATTSAVSTYTNTGGGLSWTAGISVFIPRKKK